MQGWNIVYVCGKRYKKETIFNFINDFLIKKLEMVPILVVVTLEP